MWIDTASVAIRAVGFISWLQAAGVAFLLALCGRTFRTSGSIARLGRWSAMLGAALVVSHQLLDAGRMAGELAGVLDPSLQYLSLDSSSGAANALRLVGLIILVLCLRRSDRVSRYMSMAAAIAICVAFTLTGHSSVHEQRWLLAPLLSLHLIAAAFWFGALWPLVLISRYETPQVAARLVAQFSERALGWVPLIAVAGMVMAYLLLPDLGALRQPYGWLLLTKLGGFSLLMMLAALNKWRFGPRLASDNGAMRRFRYSVMTEFVLICAVLGVTAVMTALFSPEP